MEIQYAKPIYQQVYTKFKNLILTGKIAPGQKIVMSKLAAEYNISRTPLREALRQLEVEGLIIQNESGMKVVELKREDFIELYQCRLLLEKEVLRSSIENMADSDIYNLEFILKEAKASIEQENYLRVFELNTSFHRLLREKCENKHMLQLLEQVISLLLMYRANINLKLDHHFEIFNEHKQIFEAVKEKDTELAIKLLDEHLMNDRDRGLAILQD